LLKFRREDPVLGSQQRGAVDGAVLGEQAFVLRFFADDGMDRILLVNLGRDLHLLICPEPLLAPPEGTLWQLALSTEDPRYGGGGTGPIDTGDEGWRVPGEAAALLVPVATDDGPPTLHHGRAGGGKGRIVY
jgi:maltooligosyltrehalose trehalohydrolase